MRVSRIHLSLLAFLVIALSFGLAVFIDYEIKNRHLHKLVSSNTTRFAEMVLNLNIEVYDVLYKLKQPAHCDAEVFERLVYTHKHIQNIGVLKDDTVVCDIYHASLKNKKLENYHTFGDDQGRIFKFWSNKDYITIAAPSGYFIEYDMKYYLDFVKPDEISGFAILGRQSNELWFDEKQHALSEEDAKQVSALLVEAFASLNDTDQLETLVQQVGPIIYKLSVADGGSIVATYIHRDYADPFHIVSTAHVIGGITLGILLSIVVFSYYLRQRTLKNLIKKAIANEEFFMVYQPLVDLKDPNQHVLGFEALVRWQLPNGDFIRPDVFIPEAEQAHLTKALTKCLIDKIFADMHEVLKQNPHLYISVNITPSDLEDAQLVKQIESYLTLHQLHSNQIVIELTERVLTDEQASPGLKAIREANLAISIDDFGTGSSNIHYLAKLEPDIIKVDRSFVVWSDSEGPTSTLLEKLIVLGKDFNLKVVVEGVETKEQASRCITYGADVGQGYFWSKPLNVGEAIKLLPPLKDTA